LVCSAFDLALPKAGRSIAARIVMMAITTNNSMSVKPSIALGAGHSREETARLVATIRIFIIPWKLQRRAKKGDFPIGMGVHGLPISLQ
jgi:hypothetical protein